MANIWHTLAENALAGKYSTFMSSGIWYDIPDELNSYWRDMVWSIRPMAYWSEMTPEEQCLFLLFCGESYED